MPHFTVAYWCVLIAALLPVFCSAAAKRARKDFDNHAPREWLSRLEGWRARAIAAQDNGFENLPVFIGAVVIAHQLGAPQGRVDLLAVAWVLVRIVYSLLYIANRPSLRSAAYTVGLLLNVAILFAGYR